LNAILAYSLGTALPSAMANAMGGFLYIWGINNVYVSGG